MRIISGTYGGRPLKSLPGDSTRPTGDKFKETMFNIIHPYLTGGVVLDLYAGSGALGIEAVSRGMNKAILVDNNRRAQKVIQENITMTKENHKFELLQTTADAALGQLGQRGEQFALIFLDPPYAKQTINEDITTMLAQDLLADDALIVCETSSDVDLSKDFEELTLLKEKSYGRIKLTLYRKEA